MPRPTRRTAMSAGITALCLGAIAAVAIAVPTHSRAGKTTAAAPIVKTTVRTTKRTVHVKNPKTIRVVRAAAAGSAGTAAVIAASTEEVASGGPQSDRGTSEGESPSVSRSSEDESDDSFHEDSGESSDREDSGYEEHEDRESDD